MNKGEHEIPNRASLLEENERLRERLEKAEKRLQDLRVGGPNEGTAPKHTQLKADVTDRTHDLLHNHQLLEAVTEGTDVPIATQDKDLRYTYLNAAYKNAIKRMTGKEPCVGMKMSEVFADLPEQSELQQEEWNQSLQGSRTNKIRQLGGPRQEARFYNVLRTPLWDEHGNIVGAGEVAHDVTEQVLTEQALRESEERAKKQAAELDAIISSLPEAVTIYDRNGRVMRTNKLSEDLLTQSGDESKGQVQILDAQGQPVRAGELPYQRALRGETVREESLYVLHEANVPVWISSSAAPIYKDGAVVGAVSITNDLSRSKLLEEELRESEKKYREMIKYAPAGIYEVDFRTRKFVSVNDLMCDLTGFSREELMQKNPMDLLDPKSQAAFQERMRAWLAGEKPLENVEYTIKKKNGSDLYALLNVTFTRDEKGNPRGATVVGYDITEWKRLEKKLQDNAQKYSLLFDGTSDGVSILDLEGRILEVNEAYCQMSGYGRSELIGMLLSGLEAKETPAKIKAHIGKLMAQGGHDRFETRHWRKDGSTYDVDITALYLEREGGQVAIFVRDMSARKQTEERLAYQSGLLDQVTDGVLGADAGTIITYWNKGMERIFGYNAEEVLGKSTVAVLQPIYEPGERDTILGKLNSSGQNKAEIRTHRKDGREIVVETNSTRMTDSTGQVSGYVVIYRDITEKKQGEEALLLSEEKFALAFANNPAAMALTSLDEGIFLEVNRTWEELNGYKKEEVLGRSARELPIWPSKEDGAAFAKELREKGHSYRKEQVFHNKKGGSFTAELTAQLMTVNGEKVILSTFVDITEKEKTEQALQSSERRYSLLFEKAGIPASMTKLPENTLAYVNEAFVRVFGFSKEEMIGKTSLELGLVRPEEQKRTVRLVQENGTALDTERHVFTKRGEERTVSIYVNKVEMDGSEYAITTLYDVTERKRAEEATRMTAQRLYTMLSNMYGSILLVNDEDKVEFTNQAFCTFFNLKESPESLRGLSAAEMIRMIKGAYLEPDKEIARIREIIAAEKPVKNEEIAMAGGKTCLRDYIPIQIEGKSYGRLWHHLDITEVKQTEEALRLSEERFRLALKNAPISVAEQDRNLRFLWSFNQRTFSPEQVVGKTDHDIFAAEDAEHLIAMKKQVLQTGKEIREKLWLTSNGKRVYLDLMLEPLHDSKGNVNGVGIATIDLTAMKKTEEDLQKSEERYRELVELSPDAIYVHRNNQIVLANPAALRVFGATSAEQVLGKSPLDFFHPDLHELIRQRIQKALEGETVPLVEGKLIQLNGAVRNTETTGSLIMEEDGPAIQVILRDITERKKKDEELQSLNRTLKALSDINQAMVRAGDEAGYMDEVCRIVVEDCGHAMVWIGMAEEDEEKNVRPVASAGFEEGYLETLHITWADTERGHGPTGTAIRTRRVSMCRNMQTDPKFAPWREQALKRGYASSIVLPLMSTEKAFGSITIYSPKADGFSDSEVTLLEELASDLSYGILMLRTRQAHAVAEEALHQSETRFRQLADASFEGLVIHEGGILLDVNERISEMVGYHAEELIGKPFWSYIDVKYHDIVKANVSKSSTDVYEVELIHKDGRRVPVEVVGRELTWKGKKARVSALRDITERKKAENVLKAANEELRRFNKVMTGRELRMIELKKEVNDLCEKTGQPIRYAMDFDRELR